MLLPILFTLLHILILAPVIYPQSIIGVPTTWSYDHDSPLGPSRWSSIDPSFTECSSGRSQSPIDLPPPSTLLSHIPSSLSIHWDDLHSSVQSSSHTSNSSDLHSLINNGHAIQVKFEPSTHSHVTYQSTHYTLAQFHFHAPSEHTVNGQYHDMELHLVHQNEQGELLVVGVFIDADPNESEEGKDENSAVDLLKALSWSRLPSSNKKGETSATPLLSLLSSTLSSSSSTPSFYHYPGSLTTPPCSEGVQWFVLTHPLHILSSQLSQYSSLFHNTARPTQPLHSRAVVLVDSPAQHPVILVLIVLGLVAIMGVVGGVWGCVRWFHQDTLDERLQQSMQENVVRDKEHDKNWRKDADTPGLARRSTGTYPQDEASAPLLSTSSSSYPAPSFPTSSPTSGGMAGLTGSPHTRMLRRLTGSRSGSNGNIAGTLKLDGDEKKGEGDLQSSKDNLPRLR